MFTFSTMASGGSGGGGDDDNWYDCFIATAAYGSILHPHVDILRRFRDRYLLANPFGRGLVKLYYAHSPVIAETISHNDILKSIARAILLPLVGFAYSTIHFGALATIALLLSITGMLGAGGLYYRKRRPKKRGSII